jgi:hypothetical protein
MTGTEDAAAEAEAAKKKKFPVIFLLAGRG